MNKVCIIVGMHRSGTSLTAKWLHSCQLNLGPVIKEKVGNPTGLYEDHDFWKFHHTILRRNGWNYDITDQKIELSESDIQGAKEIVEERNRAAQWGWKEPRTCLFLNLWTDLLPQHKSLVLFRGYENVTDSLFRREIARTRLRRNFVASYFDRRKLEKGKQEFHNHMVSVWIRYNKEILDYLSQRNPEDYMVLQVEDIIENDEKVFDLLKEKWDLDITHSSINKIYKKQLLKPELSLSLDQNIREEANQVFRKLEKLKTKIL